MTQAASLAPRAPSAAAPAPAAPTEPASTGERVERPEPGLARGRWEAPRWAFALLAALTVLGGLVWLAVSLRTRRMGS